MPLPAERTLIMAKDKTKRVAPGVLADDEAVLARLDNITDYAPSNPAYTQDKLRTALGEMRTAHDEEERAAAARDAARDRAVEKEWAVHDIAVGIRDQVTAQYGKNSEQVQTIGLKREDEYKKRARKGEGSGGKGPGSDKK
jgi:hypothetical protein